MVRFQSKWIPSLHLIAEEKQVELNDHVPQFSSSLYLPCHSDRAISPSTRLDNLNIIAGNASGQNSNTIFGIPKTMCKI